MENDEQASANPDVQAQEHGEGGSLPEHSSSGDPFDGMTHEALLAKAKEQRAIMQRNAKPKAQPAAAPATAPVPLASDALTKQDFYRINSTKAREMLKADPEMSQIQEQIASLYVNRRGENTPEDIFEDLRDAFVVYQSRNKPKEHNPAAELQTSTYVKPSSPRPQSQETRKPILTRSEPIENWYKKKS